MKWKRIKYIHLFESCTSEQEVTDKEVTHCAYNTLTFEDLLTLNYIGQQGLRPNCQVFLIIESELIHTTHLHPRGRVGPEQPSERAHDVMAVAAYISAMYLTRIKAQKPSIL